MATEQENNLRRVYNSAAWYYDMPDYDTFKRDMADKEKRKRFHASVGKVYQVPDFETFSRDMGFATAPAEQPKPTVQGAATEVEAEKEGAGVGRADGIGLAAQRMADQAARGPIIYNPSEPVWDAEDEDDEFGAVPTYDDRAVAADLGGGRFDPLAKLSEAKANMRGALGLDKIEERRASTERMRGEEQKPKSANVSRPAAEQSNGDAGVERWLQEQREQQRQAIARQIEIDHSDMPEYLKDKRKGEAKRQWLQAGDPAVPAATTALTDNQAVLKAEGQELARQSGNAYAATAAAKVVEGIDEDLSKYRESGNSIASALANGDSSKLDEALGKTMQGVWDDAMAAAEKELEKYSADLTGTSAAKLGQAMLEQRSFAKHLDPERMAERLVGEVLTEDVIAAAVGSEVKRVLEQAPGEVYNVQDIAQHVTDRLQQQALQAAWDHASEDARRMFGNIGSMGRFLFTAINNTVPKMALDYMVKATGGQGLEPLRMQGAQWQSDNTVAGAAAMAAGMAMDPTMYGALLAGAAGKSAAATRLVPGVAADVAERAAAQTLGGRAAMGAASGAANFATFNMTHSVAEQLLNEGKVDFVDVLASGGEGIALGAGMGATGVLMGNVTNQVTKAVKPPLYRVLAKGGGKTLEFATEAAVFTVPSVIEGEDVGDAYIHNLGVVAGFKIAGMAQHGPGEAMDFLSTPKGKAEMRRQSGIWRGMLDRLGKVDDNWLTDDEWNELEEYGYADVRQMTSRKSLEIVGHELSEGKVPDVTMDDGATVTNGVVVDKVVYRDTPARVKGLNEYYDKLEAMLKDTRISQSARAKMMWIVTGQGMPLSTITGSGMTQREDGTYEVVSYASNGDIVTRQVFDDANKADEARNDIDYQAELNTIYVGERAAAFVATKGETERILDALFARYNVQNYRTLLEVRENLRREVALGYGDERRLSDIEDLIDRVWQEYQQGISSSSEAQAVGQMFVDAAKKRIGEEYGVDVDEAISREPWKRSAAEAAAVNQYVRELYDMKSEDDVREGGVAGEIGQGQKQLAGQSPEEIIDRRSEEAGQAAIAATANLTTKDGTMVQSMTNLAGEKIYLYDGKVVLYDDGTVNVEASSSAIIVYNQDKGKREVIAPSDIKSVDEVMGCNDAYRAAYEEAAHAERVRVYEELGWLDSEPTEPAAAATEEQPADTGEETAIGGYGPGEIVLKDGTRGWLMGYDSETGEYEYYLESDLDEFRRNGSGGVMTTHKAGADWLNANVAQYKPEADASGTVTEQRVEPAAAEDQGESEGQPAAVEPAAEGQPATPTEGQPAGATEASTEGAAPAEGSTPAEVPAAVGDGTRGEMSVEVDSPVPVEGVAPAEGGEAAPQREEMPMVGRGDKAEPDFLAVTPKRGYDYLVDEAGIEPDEAEQFIDNSLAAARTELTNLDKKKPAIGTNLADFKKKKDAWQAAVDTANRKIDYWTAAQEYGRERKKAETEARRLRQAEAKSDEAKAQGIARIADRYNSEPKIYGDSDVLTLPNGERVEGRWVLSTPMATTTSHDPFNGYVQSDGFPRNENGTTINDRDYERDRSAQQANIDKAAKYDQRAIQNPVINDANGIVLSGNDRDMAGKLAARDNTDAAYMEYLTNYAAKKYGFTPEQVASMPHARLRFEVSKPMEYTTENFAKFNAQEMKSQSNTETAVKMGKVVSDEVFGEVARKVSRFDTLSDFYNDSQAGHDALGLLVSDGVIGREKLPELLEGPRGQEKLTEQGRKLMESVLIGKFFADDPDAVRMLNEHPSMRQRVVFALAELTDNFGLGDYSLRSEMLAAVRLCREALNDRAYNLRIGDQVSLYGKTGVIFDEYDLAEQYKQYTVMLLADLLNHRNVSEMKKVVSLYNDAARGAAAGQMDIFAAGVKSQEEILKDILSNFEYGSEKKREEAARAEQRRREASAEQAKSAVAGREGSRETGEEGSDAGLTKLAVDTASTRAVGGTRADARGAVTEGDTRVGARGTMIGVEEGKPQPTEGKPAEGKPQPAEEKPAEEKPAEEKPGKEKPGEEKSGEEKPGEGKPRHEDGASGKTDGTVLKPRMAGYGLKWVDNATKDGKRMVAVNFDERVGKDEFKGMAEIARSMGGYYSRGKGFLFKDEATAQDFGEVVMGRTQREIEDEKPLSSTELKNMAPAPKETPKDTEGRPKELTKDSERLTFDGASVPDGLSLRLLNNSKEEIVGALQYAQGVVIDRVGVFPTERSEADVANVEKMMLEAFDEDLRRRVDSYTYKKLKPHLKWLCDYLTGLADACAAERMRSRKVDKPAVGRVDVGDLASGLKSNGSVNMGDYVQPVDADGRGATPEDIATPEGERSTPTPPTPEPAPKPKKKNKWIKDEDAAEAESLIESMRNRLRGDKGDKAEEPAIAYGKSQVSDSAASYGKRVPMDADLLREGMQLTHMMMKGGLRKFDDFCEAMVDELGDDIRPHLKSIYMAAQMMEDVIDAGWDEEMDDARAVKKFDVYGFDKANADADIVAAAQHISDEVDSQDQADAAQRELKDKRNAQKPSKNTDGKSGKGRENSLSLQQGNLFDNNTDNNDGKEKEADIRPGASTGERGGRNANGHTGSLGTSPGDKAEQPKRGRVDGRSADGAMPDTQRGRGAAGVDAGADVESAPRNQRNFKISRGVNMAPQGARARFEANIKALETLLKLRQSGDLANASAEDKEALARFSGWGGLGSVTNMNNIALVRRAAELFKALGIDSRDVDMAQNSQYFTPVEFVDAMYDIARAMGYKGGRMLEGSAGIGVFLGSMPEDMAARTEMHAVEIEPTTGDMLTALYPDAKVEVQGFEKTRVKNGSVDLAITNVPFVTDLRVKDENGDDDLATKFSNLHDFCIAKNVRKLRPGGIGLFLTSSGTLESASSKKLRDWVVSEGDADFVGAFRLNNESFGGTPVTADILVVRRRVNGEKSAHAIDLSRTGVIRQATRQDVNSKGALVNVTIPLTCNQYFIDHPECVGGEMAFNFERGSVFRATSKGAYPAEGKNQSELLRAWVESFKGKDYGTSAPKDAAEQQAQQVYEAVGKDVREGSVLINKDGKLCIARQGEAVSLNVNSNKIKGRTKQECYKDYCALKKALNDALAYQREHSSDTGLAPLLEKLNRAYETFVMRYGRLNKNGQLAWLRADVDYPSVAAIETYRAKATMDGKREYEYGKADVFGRRVLVKEKEATPKDVADGAVMSMHKYGALDVDYIAEHTGKKPEDVRAELLEKELAYENPLSGELEIGYEYLSGNVREKLRQAKENNQGGKYSANIKALESALPTQLPAHLIDFTLGSEWVPKRLYEDWIKEKTGVGVTLTYAGGRWIMHTPSFAEYSEKNRQVGVHSKLGNKIITGTELIEAALNNKSIRISRENKVKGEKVYDREAMQVCTAKIEDLRLEFKEWAREQVSRDKELAKTLEDIYNEKYNNYRPLTIPNEYVPERFAGQVVEMGGRPFKMREHQAKAVMRALAHPTLLAHDVGTGKTYTQITIGMEMRRLGLARKPMIVVQNATVGQFVASAKALYPDAKILSIEDAESGAEGRKGFYAKIKYNDWDLIIISQSAFQMIPDSYDRQIRFVQDKIAEKMHVLQMLKMSSKDSLNKEADREISRIEKEIDKLEQQIGDLAISRGAAPEAVPQPKSGRKGKDEAKVQQNAEVKAQRMLERKLDDVENFDDMGIDALLIDEAHEYKHLGFETTMQRGVKGVDSSYSKKSQGVYLKVQAVKEKNNGRNVVFATGTPVSNTAAEVWTFMRYLMSEEEMDAYGIRYFDDFVRNFGNIGQVVEFGTKGDYKVNTRFSGYINLPELMRIWSSVTDTVRTADARKVSEEIPALKGGKAEDVYLPQTIGLRRVMKYVRKVLKEFEKMDGQTKKANSHIPLRMYNIAKAAAIDPRLVQADAEDDPGSKTNKTVEYTLQMLKDSESYKGTVAIFADNYRNSQSGFNLYKDIRDKLIAAGVDASQIVIMESDMLVGKKRDIFDKVNRGDVRVILGSTFTLGTGVNIQERLCGLIHVDAPNRPMDYLQRQGRMLRQGNMHKEWGLPVRTIRFAVEDSLDVTAYQRLKTKSAIVDSVMNGRSLLENATENRTLEEDQEGFGEVMANISGSQAAVLLQAAEREVRKLEGRKRNWQADQAYVVSQKRFLASQTEHAKKRIVEANEKLERLKDVDTSKVAMTNLAENKTHQGSKVDDFEEGIKEFGSAVFKMQQECRTDVTWQAKESKKENMVQAKVTVDGLTFNIRCVVTKEVDGNSGSLKYVARTKMEYDCPQLGLNGVPVLGAKIKEALADILENVVTGADAKEIIETNEALIARNEKTMRELLEREGKPFEDEDKLAEMNKRVGELREQMQKEIEAYNAKYKDMDDKVDEAEAESINYTEEEDEEDEANEPRMKYDPSQPGLFDFDSPEAPQKQQEMVPGADAERQKVEGKRQKARGRRQEAEGKRLVARGDKIAGNGEQARRKPAAAGDRWEAEAEAEGKMQKAEGKMQKAEAGSDFDDVTYWYEGIWSDKRSMEQRVKDDETENIGEEYRETALDLEEHEWSEEACGRAVVALTDQWERLARMHGEEPKDEAVRDLMESIVGDLMVARRELYANVIETHISRGGERALLLGNGEVVRYQSEAVKESAKQPGMSEAGKKLMHEEYYDLDTANGEMAHVERVFRLRGGVEYDGTMKITGPDDVAYISRTLEDAQAEHIFAILTDENDRPTLIELGVGHRSATTVDEYALKAACDKLQPKEVYLVHNHPSGNMAPSVEDRGLLERMRKMTGYNVQGLIMDTYRHEYCTFEPNQGYGEARSKVRVRPMSGESHPVEVYGFDRMVYHNESDICEQPIAAPDKAAAFVASARLGDRNKMSLLVLSRSGKAMALLHLSEKELTEERLESIVEDVAHKTIIFGGDNMILFGDFKGSPVPGNVYKKLSDMLKDRGVTLRDVIHVNGNATRFASAYDNGEYLDEDILRNSRRMRAIEAREGEVESQETEGMRQEPMAVSEPGVDEASLEAKEGKAREMAAELNSDTEVLSKADDIKDTEPWKRAQAVIDNPRSSSAAVERARQMQASMRSAAGFYDPSTGKVYVILENNASAEDVAATMLHENVAHKGLREMVGEDRYDEFCIEVYNHLDDEMRERADKKIRENGWDVPKGVDELLGEMAEKPFEEFSEGERGFWQKLKDTVLGFLRKFLKGIKLPSWLKLGDNELRYMLWQSHADMKRRNASKDVVDEARERAKREELGLDLRMRDKGRETSDIFEDESLSMHEKVAQASLRLSENNKADGKLRADAQESVGMALRSLVHEMRNKGGVTTKFKGADNRVDKGVAAVAKAQRKYDKATVKRVVDLTKVLIGNKYLHGMTEADFGKLLSAVRDATGKEDIGGEVNRVLDVMIDRHLENCEEALHSLLKAKGAKIDAKGVSVAGKLDPAGALVTKTMKDWMTTDPAVIAERMADVQDKMSSADAAVAADAASEYVGLELAKEYAEEVSRRKKEMIDLANDLDELRESHKAKLIDDDSYRQGREAIEEAMRMNKLDRAAAHYNVLRKLADKQGESVAALAEFHKKRKARLNEIRHAVNSDLKGVSDNAQRGRESVVDMMLNGLTKTLFSPLATFDMALRGLGMNTVDGEGRLYRLFGRGWMRCRNKEIAGVHAKYADMDSKVLDVSGGKMTSWAEMMRKVSSKDVKVDGRALEVEFVDNGKKRKATITQGGLMYLYMIDKMSDGRMKLAKMGISSETVAALAENLDSRLRVLADWAQSEFLPAARKEYNETHRRMYGASMAEIEEYFPLRINKDSRAIAEDVDKEDSIDGGVGATVTGAIKNRTRNCVAIDLLNTDAMAVLLDHVAEMEHWNAFCEWGRDMNALLSDTKFRNRIKNMPWSPMFGKGEEAWRIFKDVCRIAAGTYKEPLDKFTEGAIGFARNVTAACVAFRLNTALKQFLSAPAYLSEISWSAAVESMRHPENPWNWCLENLPQFKERWLSRVSGDPRLQKTTGSGWNDWRRNVVQIASRMGMLPNAFVDALTVCIGAHAIYKTRLQRYLQDGYEAGMAEARAKEDASNAFNQTQQSAEGMYMSQLQASKRWLPTLFTIFRNSPMSYTRKVYDAMRNIARRARPGFKEQALEKMEKLYMEDGLTDKQAKEAAERKYDRQLRKDLIDLGVFGFLLSIVWNMGGRAWAYLFGSDDDRKEAKEDVAARIWTAPLEGLAGGDMISNIMAATINDDWNENTLTKDMPLTGNLTTAMQKMSNDRKAEGANDLVNLAVQMGVGVNPQTFESMADAVLGMSDAASGDPTMGREGALWAASVLNAPPSQIRKMYFAELDMNGAQANALTPSELIERYTRAQVVKGRTVAPWTWSDDSGVRKAAYQKIREKALNSGDEQVNAEWERYMTVSVEMGRRLSALQEASRDNMIGEAQAIGRELERRPYDMAVRGIMLQYNRMANDEANRYLKAKTPEEALQHLRALQQYKRQAVEEVRKLKQE